MDQRRISELREFVDLLKKNPAALNLPQLAFFKEWLLLLGAKLPTAPAAQEAPAAAPAPSAEKPQAASHGQSESKPMEVDSDSEGEPEPAFEQSEQVPEETQAPLSQGSGAAPSEEATAEAQELFSAARAALGDGNHEEALSKLSAAIDKDSTNSRLFAFRARLLVGLKRPNAAVRDGNKALELNPDSALGLKWRGKAHALLGHWIDANKDLNQSNNLNYDEEIVEWLKLVKPNALKLTEHLRRKEDRAFQKRQARLRRQREAQFKAQSQAEPDDSFVPPAGGAGGFGGGAGGFGGGAGGFGGGAGGFPMGGMGGMPPGLMSALNDPEVLMAMQDPEVMAALQDCMGNPGNIEKYATNPKFQMLFQKLKNTMGGSGGVPPGGPAGFGGPGGDDDFSGSFAPGGADEVD